MDRLKHVVGRAALVLGILAHAACGSSAGAPVDAAIARPTDCAGGTVPEGTVCDASAGTVCVSGQCESPTPIATGQQAPYGLVVVGGDAYWANQITVDCINTHTNCGSIATAPVTSNAVTATVLWSGSGVDLPAYLTSNGEALGFTCDGINTSVATMNMSGGAQAILYFASTSTTLMTMPSGCAMDGTSIYWGDSDQGLFSAPIDGSAVPSQLATGAPVAVAVDAVHLYWSDGQSPASIWRSRLDGSAAITMATGLGQVPFLVVDDQSVYFTDNLNGTVNQVPIAGGDTLVLANGEQAPLGIAVDATDVYWAANGSGVIKRAPIDGGAVVTLAIGQTTPAGVAVDASYVYWTATGDGTVMRLAK